MKHFRIIVTIIFLWSSQLLIARNYNKSEVFSKAELLSTSASKSVFNDWDASLKESGNPAKATTDEFRGFVLEKPYALIKLFIPQRTDNPVAGTATVQFAVTYEYQLNSEIKSAQKNLTLAVKTSGVEFRDIDYIKIDGALNASVSIVSVTGVADFPQIEMELSSVGSIFRFLGPSQSVQNLHYAAPITRADGTIVDGNLLVEWSELPQAEGYELEWTYLSNQGPEKDKTLTKAGIVIRDMLFKNNSSRVSTLATSYFIPLVYEKGLIVFRVRPIGKNIAGGAITDIKGAWTIEDNQTSLSNVNDAWIFAYSGLEINLNWQSSISFAEEGKNKASVSYHDGSLRNRQTITRMNTDGRAIAGETMYDFNGRPVLQTLPAPISGSQENNLNYRPHLNVKEGETTLEKSDYDLATQGDGCTPVSPALSTGSGASRYYSPDNGFNSSTTNNTGEDILNKNLIPQANGYPYTQTQYTPDNTGRIRNQSGVGAAHKLGSGHDTRYMYGAPVQTELSRLFGNQVGLGGHYKKNTVVDANGQVSVSYLDLDGKVVATALAGNSPNSVEQLDGSNSRTISLSLLNDANNVLDSDQRGKTFQHAFSVTTKGDYQFSYTLNAGTYPVECTNKTDNSTITLQLAGVFDARVELYDECGTPLIGNGFLQTQEQFGQATAQSLPPFNRTVPNLEIGEYRLVKNIRINQSKLDNYLQQYLQNPNYTCVLSDQHFLATAYDDIDFSGCGITCSECITKIDELVVEVEAKGVVLTIEEKSALYSRCESICLENTTCNSALLAMLADFAPGGQYGKVRGTDDEFSLDLNNSAGNLNVDAQDKPIDSNPSSALTPENFKLSVFNSQNFMLPNQFIKSAGFARADWRKPIQVKINNVGDFKNQNMFTGNLSSASYHVGTYYNSEGNIVYAFLEEVSPGVYTPAVVSGAPVIAVDITESPRIYKVEIKYLANLADFLNHWESHFANYLVPYHPEFGYFVECTSRQPINNYIEKLIDMDNPTQDVDGLFTAKETIDGVDYYVPRIIRPGASNANTSNVSKDPYFTSTIIPESSKGALASKFINYRQKTDINRAVISGSYYNMAEAATVAANCPDPHAPCKRSGCETGKIRFDDVQAWAAFKSFYLTERSAELRSISTRNAIQGGYYNGCIGNSPFVGSSEAFNMLTRYSPTPSFTSFSAAVDAYCNNNAATYHDNPILYWHCNWGHLFPWGRSHLLQYMNIPLYDPAQTCNSYNARLYGKKIRQFYQPIPNQAPNKGTRNYDQCYEIVRDASTGEVKYVPTNCNLAMVDQVQIGVDQSKIREYQNCGVCPMTTQVKELVSSLIGIDRLEGTVNDFNCFVNTPNFTVGTELRSLINSGIFTNQLLDYTGSYNATTNKLTSEIFPSPGSGSGNTIRMTLDFSGSGIPTATLSDPTKRVQLFNTMELAGITKDATLNGFTLKFYVNLSTNLPQAYSFRSGLLANATNAYFPSAQAVVRRYEMTVTGTLDVVGSAGIQPVDMLHCSFPAICQTTELAPQVLGWLNTLVYEDPTPANTVDPASSADPIKPYDLMRTNPLIIRQSSIYETSTRTLLNKTSVNSDGVFAENLNDLSAQWSSVMQGSSLVGTISYTENSVAKSYAIRITPETFLSSPNASSFSNTVDFQHVEYFANVRPFEGGCTPATSPCPNNKFFADAAVLETVGGLPSLVFHRVVIELSKTSGSTVDYPAGTVCTKIQGQ